MSLVQCIRFITEYLHSNSLKGQRQDVRNEIAELNKVHAMFDANLTILKMRFNELTAKDQSLDKQFSTTFSELVSVGVLDQVYRIFK